MSKEISKKVLEKLAKDYAKDTFAKARQHALLKTDIAEAVQVNEAKGSLNHRFSIDIKTLPAANQKQSGRCWIFAGLNFLREPLAKKLNLEEFEFSQNYTAFYDKLEKTNFFLETVISLRFADWDDRTLKHILTWAINDGGQWDMLTANIKKYGLVPKDAMPETFASSHTRTLDMLMNRRLRHFAVEVKDVKDEKKVTSIKEKCLADIYQLLCDAFGVPPTKFDFEYVDKDKKYHRVKDLTPLSFFEKYVDVDVDDYVSLIDSPREITPYYEMYTVKHLGSVWGVPVRHLNLPLEEIKKAVISQLKEGEVVWFGSDCSKFGNRQEGMWAPENFDYESLFNVDFSFEKTDMLYACESAMNHAMCITGVDIKDKKANKWKIENSWGQDIANKGYFVASDKWFDDYVYQAVVNKKHLSAKAKKALNTKLNELEPWDPMGTLA